MRILAKFLLIFLIVLPISYYLYTVYEETFTNRQIDDRELLRDYTTHRVQRAQTGNSIEYQLPSNATNFKLLIYPLVDKQYANEKTDVKYTLKVSYGDDSSEFELSSTQQPYQDITLNELKHPFLFNDDLNVGSSRLLEVRLGNSREVMIEVDSGDFSSYVVRAFIQKSKTANRSSTEWSRTSIAQKKKLAKSYPFDVQKLSSTEIHNLYSNLWSRISPVISSEEVIQVADLYEYKERSSLVPLSRLELLDRRFVYLPKGNTYTFNVLSTTTGSFEFNSIEGIPAPVKALLNHQSVDGQQSSRELTLSSGKLISFEPGKYEITFSRPIGFVLNETDDNENIERPDLSVYYYYLKPGALISYNTTQIPGQRQRFKAEIIGASSVSEYDIHVQYAGSKRTERSYERFQGNYRQDPFAPFSIHSEEGIIDTSNRAVLDVTPSDFAPIEITLKTRYEPILIAFYNTFSTVPSLKVINTKETDSNIIYKDWLAIKSSEHLSLLRNKGYIPVEQIDKYRLSQTEETEFERLYPETSTISKRVALLAEQPSDTSFTGNSYYRVPTLRGQIHFKDINATSKEMINPKLIIIGDKENPSGSVRLAGRDLSFKSKKAFTVVHLPRVPNGSVQQYRINADGNYRYYLNFIRETDTKVSWSDFIKIQDQMSFKIQRLQQYKQLINIKLLATSAGKKTLSLKLKSKTGSVNTLTTTDYLKIIYDDTSLSTSESIANLSQCEGCILYERQFFVLNDDLDLGDYSLEVSTKDCEECYVSLSLSHYGGNEITREYYYEQ